MSNQDSVFVNPLPWNFARKERNFMKLLSFWIGKKWYKGFVSFWKLMFLDSSKFGSSKFINSSGHNLLSCFLESYSKCLVLYEKKIMKAVVFSDNLIYNWCLKKKLSGANSKRAGVCYGAILFNIHVTNITPRSRLIKLLGARFSW